MNKLEKQLDLLIIGAGVAGLTAGMYASRLKLNTLILEDELIGGQIKDAYIVENYPGFQQIKGSDLIDQLQKQAVSAGARIDEFDKVTSVTLQNGEKIIETETARYHPKTLIIAAGMKRRELPIAEEKKFRGNGIHYCELCDGPLYEGKTIAVVGGGNAAMGAADFLSKYAKKIYIIHRSDRLSAEALLQEKCLTNSKIEVLWNTRIVQAIGESTLEGVLLENIVTRQKETFPLDGVFVNIGATARTDLYKEYLALDESGHIIADETCQTNIAGVFAAGDVRTKPIRQLTTAAADGTVAALLAEKYLMAAEDKKNRLGA